MKKHTYYNSDLKKFAHTNRYNMTKAEAFLWKFVLKASLTGYKFRIQRPVLNYISDFMCIKLNLIIEVDGYTHLSEQAKEKDKIRQQILEQHGFTAIRFTDSEVLKSLGWVNDKIVQTIKELEKQNWFLLPPPRSSGTPSASGGRWFQTPVKNIRLAARIFPQSPSFRRGWHRDSDDGGVNSHLTITFCFFPPSPSFRRGWHRDSDDGGVK